MASEEKTVEERLAALEKAINEDLPKYLHAFTTKMRDQEDNIASLTRGFAVVTTLLQEMQQVVSGMTPGGIVKP